MLQVVNGGPTVPGGMSPPSELLREKLRLLRQHGPLAVKKGTSLPFEELAGLVDSSAQHLNRIEKGKTGVGRDLLYRLARAHGLSEAVHLLLDDGVPPGDVLNIATSRAPHGPRKEVPDAIAKLPEDVLTSMASAIEPSGAKAFTLTVEAGEPHSVVVREGRVVYDDVEHRKARFGGRRGAAA